MQHQEPKMPGQGSENTNENLREGAEQDQHQSVNNPADDFNDEEDEYPMADDLLSNDDEDLD